ncbi:MAG: PQQ-binding-like beta-propeller repeat protein [Thermoanaerobaculia bacterium]
MQKIAMILFLSLFLGLPSPGYGQVRLWSRDIGGNFYFLSTSTGDLLVSTQNKTMLLDGETGETIWTRDDLTGCKAVFAPIYQFECKYLPLGDLNFEILPSVQRMIGHESVDGELAIFDLETGATVFEPESGSFGKIRRYVHSEPSGQLAFFAEGEDDEFLMVGVRLADGRVMWQFDSPTTKDPAWLGVLEDGSVLMYGKNDGERILAMLDLKEGTIAWQNDEVLDEDVKVLWAPKLRFSGKDWRPKQYRIEPLIFDSESTLISFVTKDGPMRLSRDGELIWRGVDLDGKDPSQMILAEGVLYLLQEKNVFAIDSSDGRILWRVKARFDPDTIELHDQGLLVWSKKRLDLLDTESGSPRWRKELDISEAAANAHVVTSERIYVAGKKVLSEVNILDGGLTRLARYEFDDGEGPTRLSLAETSLILESPQNFARYDLTSQEFIHRYYKSPRSSGWARFGAYARGGLAGFLTVFGARYGYTALRAQYSYYYFENEDGGEARRFAFIRVDRETGQEEGTLWLNQRKPEIIFDSQTEILFSREKGSLEAARFIN